MVETMAETEESPIIAQLRNAKSVGEVTSINLPPGTSPDVHALKESLYLLFMAGRSISGTIAFDAPANGLIPLALSGRVSLLDKAGKLMVMMADDAGNKFEISREKNATAYSIGIVAVAIGEEAARYKSAVKLPASQLPPWYYIDQQTHLVTLTQTGIYLLANGVASQKVSTEDIANLTALLGKSEKATAQFLGEVKKSAEAGKSANEAVVELANGLMGKHKLSKTDRETLALCYGYIRICNQEILATDRQALTIRQVGLEGEIEKVLKSAELPSEFYKPLTQKPTRFYVASVGEEPKATALYGKITDSGQRIGAGLVLDENSQPGLGVTYGPKNSNLMPLFSIDKGGIKGAGIVMRDPSGRYQVIPFDLATFATSPMVMDPLAKMLGLNESFKLAMTAAVSYGLSGSWAGPIGVILMGGFGLYQKKKAKSEYRENVTKNLFSAIESDRKTGDPKARSGSQPEIGGVYLFQYLDFAGKKTKEQALSNIAAPIDDEKKKQLREMKPNEVAFSFAMGSGKEQREVTLTKAEAVAFLSLAYFQQPPRLAGSRRAELGNTLDALFSTALIIPGPGKSQEGYNINLNYVQLAYDKVMGKADAKGKKTAPSWNDLVVEYANNLRAPLPINETIALRVDSVLQAIGPLALQENSRGNAELAWHALIYATNARAWAANMVGQQMMIVATAKQEAGKPAATESQKAAYLIQLRRLKDACTLVSSNLQNDSQSVNAYKKLRDYAELEINRLQNPEQQQRKAKRWEQPPLMPN
ncbi:hypothetical protein COT30_02335 [Candidatus Micrarchaeota archaeon CG08_land_8_20_14_0_20_49_17]|nr:MAG: hypothetical protein COT30_02335 [Candidatus Micrarchaeota archaeon CG08_land_8_20_14_0_20_49_17]